MSQVISVKKASGEYQNFSSEKLENSLRRSGAAEEVISLILRNIMAWLYDGATTKEIYKKAFGLLKLQQRAFAARYSLKKAIMELGPTGYPFEQFIGRLMEFKGFETEVGIIVQGHCVNHEVDVLATNKKQQLIVECKFYNSQGKFANVKVPLYIHSRFRDIVQHRKNIDEFMGFSFEPWIVTNTRFSSDAIQYGVCAGIQMLSWDYPQGNSLKDIIEKNGIFPVTAITGLNKEHKQSLLNNGIALCRQINENPKLIDGLGLKEVNKQKVLVEVNDLCVSNS